MLQAMLDRQASSMSLMSPLHRTGKATDALIPTICADDTRTIPVNRIVAGSAVVDEMVLEFTHDQEVSCSCLTA